MGLPHGVSLRHPAMLSLYSALLLSPEVSDHPVDLPDLSSVPEVYHSLAEAFSSMLSFFLFIAHMTA